MNADSFKHKEITDIILKSFYEVFNELGDRFLESVYENTLYIALKRKNISDDQRKSVAE